MDTTPAAFRRALRTSPLRRRRLFLENLEPRQLLATFTVNTTADTVDAIPGDGLALDASGNTSLRAAIMEANATGAHDVIQLPAGRFELTITGTGEDFARTGDLDLRQRMEITGVSASETIIDANGLDRVFDGLNRSFDPSNPVPVYLSRLTITGGDLGIDGGAGLVNRGHAILTDVVFQGNRAGGVGGAISNADNFANLFVTGGAFIGNESDRWGGAIYNNGATLSVSGATFSGNHANILGGAIYTRSGSFTLVNSLIEDNTAGDTGGAVYSLTFGASIQTSTLRGNSAATGGAIWAGDKLVLSQSTVSGNSATGAGAGLYLAGSVNQPHSVTNSTVSGNAAADGGGIYNASWLALASSTISLNSASVGGGINARFATTTSTSVNTIIAANIAATAPDIYGFMTSLGYNLIGNSTPNSGFNKQGDLLGTPASPIDPKLGPLQDNGGPTFTLALLAGSPALDAGTNDGAPAIDQRGFLRPDNGVTDIGAFELQVGNVPPVASNLSLVLDEDTPHHGEVSATDADGDALTFAVVGQPGHGTVSMAADGSFTYAPDANYFGSDSFTYRANDGLANSNVATVNLTIASQDDPPVSADGALTTNEDAAAGGQLSASDVEGDSLTYVLVAAPAHGTAAVNGNGSYVYTPAANYFGGDSFTFKANDGTLDSNVATVAITVNPVNDAPVATDANLVTEEDTDAGGMLLATDIDGDALTPLVVTAPAHGVVALGPDGTYIYKPAANYHGSDSFTFKANDGSADSNVATVSITVSPVNDAPVAADASLVTDEDTARSGQLVATDVEADSLTYALVASTAHGTIVVNADGSFTYTPAANYHGSDSFTFKANDGNADSNVATVSITVNSVNDAPLASDAAGTLPENSPIGTAVAAVNASDVDSDQTLSFAIVAGNDGDAFAIDAAGNITVASSAALDFESQQQRVLTIEVRDNGTPQLADQATATIDLTNVIETTVVPIDIAPGKTPNVIDVRKGGKVSVAILSTVEFDAATMVDIESLTFGRTGDEPSLVRRGKLKTPVVSRQDSNGDGRLDLVAQFDVGLAGFQAGDVEGILRGRIIGGELLEGRDSVTIKGRTAASRNAAASWAIAADAFYAELADSTTRKKRARHR